MSPQGCVAATEIINDVIDLEAASTASTESAMIDATASARGRCTNREIEVESKEGRQNLDHDDASDAMTKLSLSDECGQTAQDYAAATICRRAFPERYIALLMTLILEIPVTFIVSGGSDVLVDKIGLNRYTLLMAFLPLTSAVSGNVGLQASSLTTRAIALGHCSGKSLRRWFWVEFGAALLLAVGVGFAVAVLAAVWTIMDHKTEADLGFALTIGFAQFFSVCIAGITGTLAPILFQFVFRCDPGKWAGPMETAVQDIAGSFAIVYIAQWVLMFFIKIGVSPQN